MQYEDQKKQIETLIARAAEARMSDDAMRFSQAACNASNALCTLIDAVLKVSDPSRS